MVKVEREEGSLIRVTLDRPDVLNAINPPMLDDLERVVDTAESDGTRVAIISGAGEDALSAGADLHVMADLEPHEARAIAVKAHRLFSRMERSPVTFIVGIRGYALGGGLELSLASDIRVAGPSAKLGFPEVGIGAFPGWGGTQRLLRTVGQAAARRMLLTAEILSADGARAIGLIHEVVPDDEVLQRARELAMQIATRSPAAIAMAKSVLADGQDMGSSAALKHELEAWTAHWSHPDRHEGMAAFVEKRTPRWQG